MKDDTISRQAAIDAIDEIRHALWEIDIPSPTVPEYVEHHEQVQSVMKLLDKKQKELYALPSAQPEKRTEKRTETHTCDLIDRRAAIDAVKKNTFRLTFAEEQNCEGRVAWSAYAVSSDVIEGELLELPSAQRWIPCSERLPEDDVEVLVTDDAGGVQWLGVDKMMSYEDGSGRFWLVSQHPSAWCPLPEPYKGEP